MPFEAELAVAGLVGSYLSAWALTFSCLAGLDTVTCFDTFTKNQHKNTRDATWLHRAWQCATDSNLLVQFLLHVQEGGRIHRKAPNSVR